MSIQEARSRFLAISDESVARQYDRWVSALTAEDHEACLADLLHHVKLTRGQKVLDAGAGTGALCLTLSRLYDLRLVALEPAPEMAKLFRAKASLAGIELVQGFSDCSSDRRLFPSCSFDVIASRQLVNCLYDPLAAFHNWFDWLRPGGTILAMDGLFSRSDWEGPWAAMLDTLPVSACQTLATVPYLLEAAGFHVVHAGLMTVTNALPTTRTPRYLVVGKKPEEIPTAEDDAEKQISG